MQTLEPLVTDDAHAEISAADRVLQVLAVLACTGRALTAGELMQRTGLPRSSLYRQLARLKRFGFVAESGGLYAPGPLGLQLAPRVGASAPGESIGESYVVSASFIAAKLPVWRTPTSTSCRATTRLVPALLPV